MRKLLISVFVCFLFSSITAYGKELPGDYPSIEAKTVCTRLDTFSLAKAKMESPTLSEMGDASRQMSYWLDVEENSPVTFQVITPYSAARYLFYKADAQYKPISREALVDLTDFNNVLYLWVRPAAKKAKAPITHVVIEKDGIIYQPLPPQYIANTLKDVVPDWDRQLWAFPANLLDGKSAVRVIAVNSKDQKTSVVLSPAKQFALK